MGVVAALNRLRRWLARLLESPRASIPVDLQSEGCVYLNVHARPALRAALERNLIEDHPDFGERGLLSDWPRDGNGSPLDGDDELPIG